MILEESITIIKALADNSRLTIINALLERPHYVEELSERLKLAESTISFHLKKLEKAGLVTKKKEQYYVMFSVNPDALDMTLRTLIEVRDIEKTVQEERMQQYRAKVIHTFFRQNSLTQIPAQQKKRLIVLEELAKQFRPERQYTEQEVNGILLLFYNDYCTLRREMVDYKILAREGGMYWLIDKEIPGPALLTSPIEKTTETEKEKRKAIKRAYKQKSRLAGVFQIKNLANGKVLIGSSTNVESAVKRHKAELQLSQSHQNKELAREWKEFGSEHFSFDILETLADADAEQNTRETLKALKARWLEKLQPYGKQGYHKRPKD